jgi:hypothetical protein
MIGEQPLNIVQNCIRVPHVYRLVALLALFCSDGRRSIEEMVLSIPHHDESQVE